MNLLRSGRIGSSCMGCECFRFALSGGSLCGLRGNRKEERYLLMGYTGTII